MSAVKMEYGVQAYRRPSSPRSPSVASKAQSGFWTPKTSWSHPYFSHGPSSLYERSSTLPSLPSMADKKSATQDPSAWHGGANGVSHATTDLRHDRRDGSGSLRSLSQDECGEDVRWSQKRLTQPDQQPVGCLCLGGFWRGKRFMPMFTRRRRSSFSIKRFCRGLSRGSDRGGPMGVMAPPSDLAVFHSPVAYPSRMSSVGLSTHGHRASASDSNSEFWDAVEMLDDLGDNFGGASCRTASDYEGEESVVKVELLGRTFDITIRSSCGTIAVAFLLTETIRRYAGLKVFHEDDHHSTRNPITSNASSLKEKSPSNVDVHRLIPACRGLINKRTGDVYPMESQLQFEGLVGDTFEVDLRRELLGGGQSSGLITADSDLQRGASTDTLTTMPSRSSIASVASLGNFMSSSGEVVPTSVEFPLTSVPRYPGVDGDGNNCWSQPDATEFMVRGLTYMNDKVKVASQPAAYKLLGVDLLLSEAKHSCVSQRARSFVSRCRASKATRKTFIFAVNFSLPWGSFIAYFCPQHEGASPYVDDPKLDALLDRFIHGDDDFRNRRLKLIPRCVEGPWMVKSAVGSTPAIMGTKISHTYYSTENTFEVEVDISSSVPAQYILGVVKSFTQIVSVDLAFVIQGEDETELPERVLFAVRFHHLAVSKAPTFDKWDEQLDEASSVYVSGGGGDDAAVPHLPPPPLPTIPSVNSGASSEH